MRSTIWMISSWVSCGNTTTLSTRLRNSGLKWSFSFEFTSLTISSYVWPPSCATEKPVTWRLRDRVGAEVGRHDDDGVLEVDLAALSVGQLAVLQDLEERVEDVRVGLLDLVEQDDGERLAAHLLGELAALFEADVAGRRTEQSRHRVLLAVLGHVEADERVLVAEQELGERLGELGLSDARGAGEDERATGTLGVLEAGTRAADRLRQHLDGLPPGR